MPFRAIKHSIIQSTKRLTFKKFVNYKQLAMLNLLFSSNAIILGNLTLINPKISTVENFIKKTFFIDQSNIKMNENRYPVTASLFMLKEIKHRQEQVNRGYQLLKRKAEALRIRGRQVTSELASTQAILGHILREAYITLAAIKFTNGESNALVLESIGQVS